MRSYLRSAIANYATQMVALPLGFMATALQVRLLGPAGRGQIVLFTTTTALSVLYLGLGLNSAITYHVARGSVNPRNLLRPLAMLLSSLSVGLGIILSVISRSHGAPFVLPAYLAGSFGIAAFLTMFMLLTVNGWLIATLAAYHDFKGINIANLLAAMVPVPCYAVILRYRPDYSIGAVVAILIGAETLRCAALLRWSGPRLRMSATSLSEVMPLGLSSMLGYSLLAYIADAIQFLTYRLDIWLVRYFRNDAELGLYSLAVTVAELVWALPASFGFVLFPQVPTLRSEYALALAVRAAALSVLISAVTACTGYALAIPLFPILFSRAFSPSVPLLGILLLGIVPYSIAKVLANYLAGAGAMRLNVGLGVLGLVLCAGLDLLFIPRAGARGAAVASALAYGVYTVCVIFAFYRHSGCRVRQLVALARGAVQGGP